MEWDINLFKLEQSALQPIHENYLKNSDIFIKTIKKLTDSENSIPTTINDKQKIKGGVDILDKNSRIKYGCKLLEYTEEQGCKP